MAKKSRKDPIEELYAELEQAYEHWQYLYENGGSDPFWPDGVNLNLVRNHILYYKGEIQKIPGAEQREILLRDIPKEVSNGYMADPQGILQRAESALRKIKENPDFCYIREHISYMNPETVERMHLNAMMQRLSALECAIRENDYVTMRRILQVSYEDDYYAEKAEAIRNLQPEENEQLSLFYASSFEEEKSPKTGPQWEGMI